MLKDKRKKSKSKPSSRALPDPSKNSSSSKLKKIPEVEYQYLTEHPFSFTQQTIQHLLREVEKGNGGYTLHDYASWWKDNYFDKGKDSSPFALISSAIKLMWDLNEYRDWGLEQIYG